MDFPSSRASEDGGRLRTGAGPLLALVLVGLLADVARPEGAYAGIGYGLSLLALLGAAWYAVRLTGRLATRLDPLPWGSPAAPAARTSTSDQDFFGPLAVLISGLGGWV